jgi:cupin fold WbuC family metalloprotein
MLPFIQENPEVIYGKEMVIKVAFDDTKWLKDKAGQNERKRIRLCAHGSIDDAVHEMIIVHARGTYVRPHKHLGKSESFHIIEGKADVVLFDDIGNIIDVIKMGNYETGMIYFYRISNPVFHTLLIHSEVLVFHETTSGPFDRSDTVFASWSPEEGKKKACAVFMSHLTRQTIRME